MRRIAAAPFLQRCLEHQHRRYRLAALCSVLMARTECRPCAAQILGEIFGDGAEHAFHFRDLSLAESLARPRQRDHADQHASWTEHGCGYRGATWIALAQRDVETFGTNGVVAWTRAAVVSQDDVPGSATQQRVAVTGLDAIQRRTTRIHPEQADAIVGVLPHMEGCALGTAIDQFLQRRHYVMADCILTGEGHAQTKRRRTEIVAAIADA